MRATLTESRTAFVPGVWTELSLPDARVRLLPGFLPPAEADALFAALHAEIPWRQDHIRMFGKTNPVPRLHQWFGAPEHGYTWSGIAMTPAPWTPTLDALRARVALAAQAPFNTALANLYRNGQDSVAWHADDEPELGPDPIIASVSLGAERTFLLRHRVDPAWANVAFRLPHGSLLVMSDGSQRHWRHALPRRAGVADPRINLTFRWRVG